MKRSNHSLSSPLAIVLLTGLILVAAATASSTAQAAVKVNARVAIAAGGAAVVLTSGPRVGVIPKPVERRVVVTDRRTGCDRPDRVENRIHRKHRERERRVWVAGRWIQVSPRVSRYVPGHWEVVKHCSRNPHR